MYQGIEVELFRKVLEKYTSNGKSHIHGAHDTFLQEMQDFRRFLQLIHDLCSYEEISEISFSILHEFRKSGKITEIYSEFINW